MIMREQKRKQKYEKTAGKNGDKNKKERKNKKNRYHDISWCSRHQHILTELHDEKRIRHQRAWGREVHPSQASYRQSRGVHGSKKEVLQLPGMRR